VIVSTREVSVRGRLLRIARIAEGYEFLDDPESFRAELRRAGPRADLLTFIQRLSETSPKYSYPMEWENLAAVRVTTFEAWFMKQINKKTRNMIRKGEKSGITVREVPFDDEFVRGIQSINDESPVRQGRPFLHYRDDLETVRRENGTFRDRTAFIGAFLEGEMIGYIKLVSEECGKQAGLMQILSMIRHRDKAPNNMLIAHAVRSCAERGIPYLWYAHYTYRNKGENSLRDFKENNGFVQIDIPRYHVPLSAWGRIALRARLHHGVADRLPQSMLDRMRGLRDRWHAPKLEKARRAALDPKDLSA
jgi:hypothetical protein